jgi:hypothetical protein
MTTSPFASPSAAALKTPPKRSRGKAATRTPPRTASPKKMTAADMERFILGAGGYRTPERQRKRRTSSGRDDVLKPMTPSATVQSSMNASLVFDMVTALSTNDPGVAIAALRSIVVLGKEYPSNLLFEELVDRMLSVEAIAYEDAVSIYASLVFVYDKASTCSCDLEFPHQWEPLANALQDASVLPKTDERWRRLLLVVQFFVYCFLKDFDMCRDRYEKDDGPKWLYHTRLFTLLHTGDAGTSLSGRTTKRATANRLKIHNNLILQAIGAGLALWQRVYDPPQSESRTSVNNHGDTVDSTLEAKETCVAIVRLIEMLYMCTDQVQNILGRLQAGLLELSRETRAVFAQTLELPDLQTQLATTVLGLTNKSRSKEHEWYECNAMGRILQSINSRTLGDLEEVPCGATDGCLCVCKNRDDVAHGERWGRDRRLLVVPL